MEYEQIISNLYQDLPNSKLDGMSFDTEYTFIDEKNGIIVFLILSTILGEAIGYYYGLYDNNKKEIIKYNTKEYQRYISNMPLPEALQITELEEFMENRLQKRNMKKMIDNYIATNAVGDEYYIILDSLLNRAENQKTKDIISFFEKEKKEKREEEVITKTHTTNTINVVKKSSISNNTSNNREIFKQKQIELQNKSKETITQPKIKEKSHSTEIIFMTVVAIILGLLTATIVAGPWDISSILP